MVQKRKFFIAVAALTAVTVLSSFISCGRTVADGNIPSGSAPVLMTANPGSASHGSSVSLVGVGFSIVAEENIVSIGGVTAQAASYAVSNDGAEVVTFTLPDGAPTGSSGVMVIIDGEASNTLPFTVTP